MSKKFNKKRSLEEGDVILEDTQETEFIESLPTETTYVEIAVPTSDNSEPTTDLASSCQPTEAQIKFAKAFTGHPTTVSDDAIELAQSCVSKKLLAGFGADGFARGSLWHRYCK